MEGLQALSPLGSEGSAAPGFWEDLESRAPKMVRPTLGFRVYYHYLGFGVSFWASKFKALRLRKFGNPK